MLQKSESLSPSRPCPLCGETQTKLKYHINGFHLHDCPRCAFRFVKENLSIEQLDNYYNSAPVDIAYSDPSNASNLAFYYGRLRDEILKTVSSGTILDVGCSKGHFLELMSGWDVYGTEIEKAAAYEAQRKFGKKIQPTSFEDAVFDEAFFDVIAMQDVFDHFPNPQEILEKCNRLLKPGGVLILKVHNVGSLYARMMGARYYGYVPPIHLSYFSPATLQKMLALHGLRVDAVKSLPHLLYLKTIFYRLGQNNHMGFWIRLARWCDERGLGKIRFRKNLFDVMTVFARKNEAATQ